MSMTVAAEWPNPCWPSSVEVLQIAGHDAKVDDRGDSGSGSSNTPTGQGAASTLDEAKDAAETAIRAANNTVSDCTQQASQ